MILPYYFRALRVIYIFKSVEDGIRRHRSYSRGTISSRMLYVIKFNE